MEIEPVTLEGESVQLVPLSLSHHTQLCDIGLDERLWQRTTIRLQNPDDMLDYIRTALREQAKGTTLPFVLIEKQSGKVVGTSRYHHINKAHRRVEIGFTWIAVPWQRTGINTEAKYLMLQHAFEWLGCVRVEFKADTSNEQSCSALRRIGAKAEGVLRKYMVSAHKEARDVMLFSIIDTEWPDVKAGLEKMLTR